MNMGYGIVLSHAHRSNSFITLLDHHRGCIHAVYTERPLSPGLCVRYDNTHKGDRPFINSLEIIESPLAIAKDNLLFLHHSIEICLHYVPAGLYIEGLYELLCNLYEKVYVSSLDKKLFLYQLLTCIGIYPETTNLILSYKKKIDKIFLDRPEIRLLDLEHEKALTEWLLSAYQEITLHKKFFTIHFYAT